MKQIILLVLSNKMIFLLILQSNIVNSLSGHFTVPPHKKNNTSKTKKTCRMLLEK